MKILKIIADYIALQNGVIRLKNIFEFKNITTNESGNEVEVVRRIDFSDDTLTKHKVLWEMKDFLVACGFSIKDKEFLTEMEGEIDG